MIAKIMDIIIFMDTFQNIVMLVVDVVKEVSAFFAFLILWVIIFALFYQSLGINVTGGIKTNTITSYLKSSWDISILGHSKIMKSDLATQYWSSTNNDNVVYSSSMILLIRIIQFINQLYLKIIMFGFLIAMINNTYDRN